MSTQARTQVKATTQTPPTTTERSALWQEEPLRGDAVGLAGQFAEPRERRLVAQPPLVQPKLTVGQPDDRYEQEADRVADLVMRMPEPRLQRQTEPEEEEEEEEEEPLQTKSADSALAQRQEEEPEEEEEETLQTKSLIDQITPLVQRQVEPEEEEEEEEEEEPLQTKSADSALVQRQEEEEEEEEPIQAKRIEGTQVQRQVEPEEEEEEEEELVQTKQANGQTAQAGPDLETQIRSLRGGGQPLSQPTRDFFEPRLGHDFSQVRVHADARAAEAARTVHARAFTVGRDVVFGAGRYQPGTDAGKRLLAHELTHVVQQTSDPTIRRDDEGEEEVSNIDRLEQLLEDDQEDEAIALMGRMRRENPADVEHVLTRTDLRNLAVSAFNNEEMYRAVRAMNGSLYEGLQWMFAEGTSWEYVRNVIPRAPGKARVRREMRDQFMRLCNNEEMAAAVNLLGGDLEWKLRWMAEEGTSWDLVEPKLRACRDDTQKQPIRNRWKNFFIGLCNNEEMAVAVDHNHLGGNLEWKLTWMRDEGTSWNLVRPKLSACTDPAQKEPIRECTTYDWKSFFIRICNNAEMADAVNYIGGELTWKFDWMVSEGTNANLMVRAINNATPEANRRRQLRDVSQDQNLCQRIYEELSNEDARTIFRIIGSDIFAAAALLRRQFWRDWVVRDWEAIHALRLIALATDIHGASITNQMITRLKTLGRWDTLLGNLPTGSSLTRSQKDHVRMLFNSPSSNLDDCKELFEIRFDKDLVDNSAAPWDRPSLTATWDQLDMLPDSLVADNSDLDSFTRHTDPSSAFYSPGRDRITLPGSAPGTWWGVDLTVIHEVGHAVDDLVDADEWYMTDARIDWDNYGGDAEDWLDAIIAASGWGTVVQPDQRRQIREVFLEYYDDPENTAGGIAPADPNHPWNLHPNCPVVIVGRENQGANIIFNGPTLTPFGGRVFNRYPDYREFYSFVQGAQAGPDFVSAYGISSPYDWFAEQFRDHFSTTPPGLNRPPWIQNWFNNNLPP